MAGIIVLKIGTITSGNRGHAGRPGLVGGSRSSKGTGKLSNADYQRERDARLKEESRAYLKSLPMQVRVNSYSMDYTTREVTDNDIRVMNGIWKKASGGSQYIGNFVKNTFNHSDTDSGMNSKVTGIELHKTNSGKIDGIVVHSEITDSKGYYSGFMKRIIYDTGEVHHDLFSIFDEYQGSGFGSRMYQHLEKQYIKAKLKMVTLQANLEVGGYAWARMGFDFDNDWTADNMNQNLRNKWLELYPDAYNIPKFNHAWEMALATGPGGFRIGKAAMIGQSWNGIKYLDPNDTGYQIGNAYYQAKGKK